MTVNRLSAISLLLALGACATYAPTGPSAMVLPGTGKSFDQFRADDMECRQYAGLQAGSQTQAASDSTVRSAALGTAIGAVAGAAMGGRDGAGAGAGMGLIAGTLAGTGAGSASARDMQRRYDNGYQQCMYAKGHKLPMSGAGRFSSPPAYATQQPGYAPPAAATAPPPPPSNSLPPPPPPPVR
jgi:outer membrane lipoprotein SlyB